MVALRSIVRTWAMRGTLHLVAAVASALRGGKRLARAAAYEVLGVDGRHHFRSAEARRFQAMGASARGGGRGVRPFVGMRAALR